MAVYSVSYDLNNQGKNYDGLYDALKKTDYNHILDSTWLISTSETAQQISDRLRTQLDNDDHIFVSKVNSGQYQGWLPKTVWEWIKQRL